MKRLKAELRAEWKSDSGVSLAAALLFLLFCAAAVAAVLTSVSSGVTSGVKTDRARQAQFALSSAAVLLREDLAPEASLEVSAAESLIRYSCAGVLPPEGWELIGKDCTHLSDWEFEPFTWSGLPEGAILAGPIGRGLELLAAGHSRLDPLAGGLTALPETFGQERYTETFRIERPEDERFSEGCAVTAEFTMELTGETAGSWQVRLTAPDTGLVLVLTADCVPEDGDNEVFPGPVCILHLCRGEPEDEDYEEQTAAAASEITVHTLALRWDALTIDRERQP